MPEEPCATLGTFYKPQAIQKRPEASVHCSFVPPSEQRLIAQGTEDTWGSRRPGSVCGDSLCQLLRGQVCGDSGRWVAGETQGPETPQVAALTSYRWRFNFSPNSNLSVSSWYRVSHSSLAFSLGGGKGQASLEGRAQAPRCPPLAPVTSQRPRGWRAQGGLSYQHPLSGPAPPSPQLVLTEMVDVEWLASLS